jgi:monoamine oxidase
VVLLNSYNALASQLDTEQIKLGHPVQAIARTEDGLEVTTSKGTYTAGHVVSTLPPYLFAKTIAVAPGLPQQLLDIAHHTHTWMGESIKVSLAYAEPFWRTDNLSGTIFSNVGPIPEMYDHANVEDTAYALKGFFNSSYFPLTKAERQEMALQQLEKYYGPQARNFLTYEETVWRHEPYTFASYDTHVLPHQHGGHAVYQQPYLDGRLYLAGSETATAFPGYMDGAVRSRGRKREFCGKTNSSGACQRQVNTSSRS